MKPEDLLARAAGVFKDAKMVSFEVEKQIGGRTHERLTVRLKRPNLARMEQFHGEELTSLVVLDGKKSWTYVPEGKRYDSQPQEEFGATYLLFPVSGLFFDPERVGTAAREARLKRENLGRESCHVLEWSGGTTESRLWVDERNSVRRYDEKVTYRGKVYEYTHIFRGWDLFPKVADDAFSFVPPKGARPFEENPAAEGPRTPVGGTAASSEEVARSKALLERVANRLHEAKTLRYRFRWTQKSSFDQVAVTARRPDLARYETVSEDDGETFFGVLDGKSYWGFDKKGKEYITLPQGALPAKFDFDPLLKFYFEGSAKRLLALAENIHLQSVTMGASTFTVVSWRVVFTSALGYGVWIDGQDQVRMIEKFDGDQLLDRLEYDGHERDPKLSDDLFSYRPRPRAKCVYSGADEEKRLLAAGADAPDFEVTDPAGKPVRLGDFKGKVVLLHFWEFP